MVKKYGLSILIIIFFMLIGVSSSSLAANFDLSVYCNNDTIKMESNTTEMKWNLENFLPGDSDKSTVTIVNKGEKKVTVKVKIDIIEKSKLLDRIIMKVSDSKGNELYNGSYTTYKEVDIELNPGESEVITAETSLDIDAGNEYQDLEYKVQFNFVAEADIEQTEYGTLVVRYVDTDGNLLKSDTKGRTIKVGDKYDLPEIPTENFDGYTYDHHEGVLNGVMHKGTVVVNYVYKRNKEEQKTGRVIVRYIDEENNLLEETITVKPVGTTYNVEGVGKEFVGYKLIDVVGELKGVYKIEDTIITYRYEKIKMSTSDIDLPQTGIKSNVFIIVIVVVVAIFSIGIGWKIKNIK